MTSWSSTRRGRPNHTGAAVALLTIFLALVAIATVTRDRTTIASPGRSNPQAAVAATVSPSSPVVAMDRPAPHHDGNLVLTLPIVGIGLVLFLAWGSLERTLRQ